MLLVERPHGVKLPQLRLHVEPVPALGLAQGRAAGEHLVETHTGARNELLFGGRPRRGDRPNDAAAAGSDDGIGLAAQTPLKLGAPIARVDNVRVRIDEARYNGAAARIDPRGAFLYRYGIGERTRCADVRDASFESRDDAIVKGRNVVLCKAATRRWSCAGCDEISVFDEEVRGNHANLA